MGDAMRDQAGIYLHVPFCRSKCAYCGFYSFVPSAGERHAFVEALRVEMRRMASSPLLEDLRFATIFFGGGTPSLLSADALALLLADALHLFPAMRKEELEITAEVNPATMEYRDFSSLRRAGFNRLSLGIQSLHKEELSRLGRIHSADEALAAFRAARRAGFDNLSLDLMYGLPGQTPASWRETLARILDLAPEHLSLYELSVEKNTPLSLWIENGVERLPDEEAVLAMMAVTESSLSISPLSRYEISNYAVPGRQCRHNLNYWRNGLWLGLGPDAVSSLQCRKLHTVADFPAYCRNLEQGLPVCQEEDALDRESAFRETVVMGLRLIEGISIASLSRRFGIDALAYYGGTVSTLMDQGLLMMRGQRLLLTGKGLLLANQVMAKLV